MKSLNEMRVSKINLEITKSIDGGCRLPYSKAQTSNSVQYTGQAIYNAAAGFLNFAFKAWSVHGSYGATCK